MLKAHLDQVSSRRGLGHIDGLAAALSEARFNGYKGGEGIIQIAQKYGEPTKALLIIDGLREKTVISNLNVWLDLFRSSKFVTIQMVWITVIN